MEWSFDVTDGISDPLKAMDRAFAAIERDISAVDDALSKFEARAKSQAAISDMASALGKKGSASLQAPDISLFGKREPSEQVSLLGGASPEQAAAFKKVQAAYLEQSEKSEQLAASQRDRAVGLKQLDGITNVYGKDVEKLNKQLEQMERHQRVEQALALKDPTQRHIALMRIHQQDLRKLQNEQDRASREAQKLNNSVGAIKWMEIGRLAWDVGRKVFDLSKAFVELAINEASERKESVRTLEVMLGSKDAAEKEFDLIDSMSRKTKGTAMDMMSTYRMLFSFTEKYGVKATQDVIAASEDINVVLGDTAKQSFLSVVRNMEAMGKFDERSMRMLREVGVATPEKMRKILAEQRGVSEEQIKKLMSSGKIDDTEGVNALLTLVQKNLDKGKALGAISTEAAAGSPRTQLKNLREDFENLFEKLDIKPFADAMATMRKLLDPESASGKRLAEDVQKSFDLIVRAVQFGIENFWVLEGVVRGVIDYFELWGKGIKIVGEGLGDFVFKYVDMFVNIIKNSTQFVDDLFTGNFAGAWKAGEALIQGLVGGIESLWDSVTGTVKKLGTAVIDAVKDVLQIKSPSKVMDQLGKNTALGFTQGFENSEPPDVSKFLSGSDLMMPAPKFATAADLSATMAAPSIADRVAAGASGESSKRISVHAEFTINAVSGPAAQQWAEMQPQIQATFVQMFEALAEEN
jgi:hypothetical protein